MVTKHYPVIIEMDEDGVFIVSCPLFKGCHSYGETIDEAMRNIQEVIGLCLHDEEFGESDSETSFVGFREVEVKIG